MREPPTPPTKSFTPAIPEHLDDCSVDYALEGAIAWAAMAVSRALVEERRGAGDVLFDRLLALQRELTELRNDWDAQAPRLGDRPPP